MLDLHTAKGGIGANRTDRLVVPTSVRRCYRDPDPLSRGSSPATHPITPTQSTPSDTP
ncbi:hypothetical protein GALMADRAFT_234491 [Galerina marginata CBS 339.88]|uniref:Uncharacterized protein n=1 Tax=Galerina marginata (strain CBS 339.88) TaxID=685588 RepID=A0A067TQW4_GALM3|nr:hypothetical protein GALMADRAFT_234491 [Galerina marginata CBS 339.88]